jgi:high-affinity Fe2+/Pb2+ permease
MSEDPKPDQFEKRLRFGCGFLFGLLVGGVLAILLIIKLLQGGAASFYGMKVTVVAVVPGMAVLCGWLAMRRGDRFWHQAIDWGVAFISSF